MAMLIVLPDPVVLARLAGVVLVIAAWKLLAG